MSAEDTKTNMLPPGWEINDSVLRREWLFPNFIEAWAFMSKVALLAESRGHHPNMENAYNRVVIELTTHDVGGLTEKDFNLAADINEGV